MFMGNRTRKLLEWLALVAACVSSASAIAQTIDVRDFGAVGDGKTSDTAAIQKAIDTCGQKGGGAVRLSSGQFVSGTILLTNGVTLELESNATLLGSLDIGEYKNPDPFTSGNGAALGYCLVGAVGAHHIAITGGGTIDGRGKDLLAARPKGNNARPFLVRLVRCSDIIVRDVHLQGPAAWTTHFFQSTNIVADNLKIRSLGLGNNDGIDIDSCRDVTIRKCEIDSGDDAICLKTTSANPCVDVRVLNCDLKSHWAAIKFGTESAGNFENINVSSCRIRDTQGGGIKLCSVDGAHVKNVTIEDVTMDNVTLPVFIRLGARLKTFREGEAKQSIGAIEGVAIRNLTATATWPIGIVLSGIPGHSIDGVTFSNVTVHLPGGGAAEDTALSLEEKESAYPEISMFGKKFPAYGLYARHVRGLRAENVKIDLAATDARPAIDCVDAAGMQFYDWQLPASADGKWHARMESVRDVTFGGSSAPWKIEGSDQDMRIISK